MRDELAAFTLAPGCDAFGERSFLSLARFARAFNLGSWHWNGGVTARQRPDVVLSPNSSTNPHTAPHNLSAHPKPIPRWLSNRSPAYVLQLSALEGRGPGLMAELQMLKRQIVLDLSVALGAYFPPFRPENRAFELAKILWAIGDGATAWLTVTSGLGTAAGYGFWYGM